MRPGFLIADPTGDPPSHALYRTQAGSEPEPAYILRKPDPSAPNARNCYAVALFDAYNSEVLFGEVLVRPKWTHPTLSQDEIRKNGGGPPPPEPIMPTDFTIQLYNPDQQIHVTHKAGGLLGGERWEFGVPQDTFRMPSTSILDRSQNDPTATSTTPRMNFAWKRPNTLTKEISCFLTGKSTDNLNSKKKNKEPDIPIAVFKSLREIMIYEPNLYRRRH